MNKAWQAYTAHVLDAIEKIRRIQQRGDITQDEVLYDATLRNLQTLSEATQRLPDALKRIWPAMGKGVRDNLNVFPQPSSKFVPDTFLPSQPC